VKKEGIMGGAGFHVEKGTSSTLYAVAGGQARNEQ
jgi:hypothetical protein